MPTTQITETKNIINFFTSICGKTFKKSHCFCRLSVNILALWSKTNSSISLCLCILFSESWIDLDQRRVYVVYNETTYDEAEDNCKTSYHATLVMFASLPSYLDLHQSLNLTENYNYWVAGKAFIQG